MPPGADPEELGALEDPGLFDAPPLAEQERMVEAMLFATSEPLTLREMGTRMPQGCDPATAVAMLQNHYRGRGVNVVQVGGAWALRTAPDVSFLMQKEVVETRKLSRAAIETLAIIAYHQPATRAEIEEIRGVAVSRGTIDLLLDLDWIRIGRRRETPGRPVTFIVTEAFLDHFSLSSARDLPGLGELRAAGLLDARRMPGQQEDAAETDDAGPEDEEDEGQEEMF
ncbi:SMC-Scp complex subunit ScpB [Mangrovicoccus sp. HB182678]|uniref:SMC-Scp complex subunit ScpB n=2 Tax=Mangrovicoccus algicola TaxID=2771008 RepID=A0A8J6YWT4_9RHOB|nr:SMC-Scp complex subunit ScpB [Mangrovicoccus algicola]MBE3637714.1 SMC-Scp complex subunit ScpB [Mangrovicoccus algicola]